jgi:hypothetical protein
MGLNSCILEFVVSLTIIFAVKFVEDYSEEKYKLLGAIENCFSKPPVH